jgi:small Trp-rich protein
MWFLIIGLVLGALKWAAVEPVVLWPWWVVLLPFGLAAAWWSLADKLGFTRRAQERKLEQKQAERRRKQVESLRSGPPGDNG